MQEDGRTDEVRPYVPDDPRVTFRQGRPGGPGVARTIALAHATGPYVKVLDADDLLTPDALARDLAALEADPALGWATSRALDRLPDGSTIASPATPRRARSHPARCSRTGRPTPSRWSSPAPCSSAVSCCSPSAAGWPCPPPRTPACCWPWTR